jgi:hypothetical protein
MLDDVDFAKHLKTEKGSAKRFQNSTDDSFRKLARISSERFSAA